MSGIRTTVSATVSSKPHSAGKSYPQNASFIKTTLQKVKSGFDNFCSGGKPGKPSVLKTTGGI